MTRYVLLFERTASGFDYRIEVSCAVVGPSHDHVGITRSFQNHTEMEAELLSKAPDWENIGAARAILNATRSFADVTEHHAKAMGLLVKPS
jgi:hypothetical protein